MVDKLEVETAFRKLQNEIIDALEKADGLGVFRRDEWKRDGGGGGITAIMEQGTVIEKGGVNFSAVFGELSKEASKALGVGADAFYATGVSIVLHPKNPFVPIIHMNIRYFETENGQYWFGGGIDLTPFSYTHLTLPTFLSLWLSCWFVAGKDVHCESFL